MAKPGEIIYKGKIKNGQNIVIRYPVMKDLIAMTEFINKLSREKTYLSVQGEKISLSEGRKGGTHRAFNCAPW